MRKPQKISPLGLDRPGEQTVVLSCEVETGVNLHAKRVEIKSVLYTPVRRAVSEWRGIILPAPKCHVKSMLCLPLTTWWVV